MYFSVGLFLFIIYFFSLFLILTALLKILTSNTSEDIYLSLDYPSISRIFIFLFCFISGGILFSLFLVQSLSQILTSITELSKGNYDKSKDLFMKNGKLKWYHFLYKEVITNLKTLENSLKANSIEREKIESAKNDWLASVSHDLKTPLSYINGYSSLLLNESNNFNKEEIETYLKEIYSKGIYIGKLIDDLNFNFSIDASGNIQLKYSQINVIPFIQNILADIANDPKGENYIFEFQMEKEIMELVIDKELMYRAIYNLLINCIEHNPSGTNVNVELTQVDKSICIHISDNGKGMNKETLEHVFDKYFSGEDKQKQVKGLGMFISKQIIEAHQGSISISSTLGKGTSVKILLKYNK